MLKSIQKPQGKAGKQPTCFNMENPKLLYLTKNNKKLVILVITCQRTYLCMMYKLLHFSSQVLPASVCGGVEESNSTGVVRWHYLCGAIQMRIMMMWKIKLLMKFFTSLERQIFTFLIISMQLFLVAG